MSTAKQFRMVTTSPRTGATGILGKDRFGNPVVCYEGDSFEPTTFLTPVNAYGAASRYFLHNRDSEYIFALVTYVPPAPEDDGEEIDSSRERCARIFKALTEVYGTDERQTMLVDLLSFAMSDYALVSRFLELANNAREG